MLPPVLRILLLATTAPQHLGDGWLADAAVSPAPAQPSNISPPHWKRGDFHRSYTIYILDITHIGLHTHRAAHCSHLHFYRTLSGEWSAQHHHRRLSHTLCCPSSGRQMGDTGGWSCCWLVLMCPMRWYGLQYSQLAVLSV